MAYEEALRAISRPSAADLTDWVTNKFTVVKLDANGAVIKVTAVTDTPAGILQNDPNIGQAARLGVDGVSKVRLGGTVAAGDQLGFGTNGRAIVSVTTHRVIGTALTAGVSGDIIPVNINTANAPIKA